MRAALAVLATAGSILVLGGCASDVGNGIDEARSSAASIASGVRSSASSLSAGLRQACQAGGGTLVTLDDLAGKLADNADQRAALAPQVKSAVDQLATEVGDRGELQPVVAAGRDLVKSINDANETAIELSGRQAQVAVRSAQTLCKITN
ncbi:MAG TPA: hypothetical protein VGP36_06395 [Mycobacteriales bacterium]|jgi:hypothetical protein|nr:hypothetical protein [Mycobacteriales bacterium]